MGFLEQLQNRQPGEPRKPEVPGAGPTASRPADKVNPLAPADGPIGRPSKPPPAFPGGRERALPGVQPSAAPAGTPPPTPPPSTPGPAQPASRPPSQGQPAQPAFDPMGGVAMQQVLDHVPSPAEAAEMRAGNPNVEIVTPFGSLNSDGSLNLSGEGEIKYKERLTQKRKKLGPHPFAGDPNSPQMDVRLGGRMFNPFTGQWVEED